MPDRCAWPRCRSPSDLVYLKVPLCDRHWVTLCQIEEDSIDLDVCGRPVRDVSRYPRVIRQALRRG